MAAVDVPISTTQEYVIESAVGVARGWRRAPPGPLPRGPAGHKPATALSSPSNISRSGRAAFNVPWRRACPLKHPGGQTMGNTGNTKTV